MRSTIIILLGGMLSTSLLAETKLANIDNHLVIGLSAGPAWMSGNETQTLSLESDVQKTYTADNTTNRFLNTELFLGWQKLIASNSNAQSLLGQLGMEVAASGNAKLQGDIWEDADPNFDNFNYSYKVRHQHIAIKGRLIGDGGYFLEPYISGSAGVGSNHAYDFTITPKIEEEVPAPPFGSNSTTSFVYTLGIGIQASLSAHVQAAIGYEFADWGKMSLSPAPGQTTNKSLSLNHLYEHEIQFSLFYI